MVGNELMQVDTEAWQSLADAARPGATSSLRLLTLGTIAKSGSPALRLLVLRRAWPERRLLELHTDMRSRKWEELMGSKTVCVLGYDDAARVQLRFEGEVEIFPPGTPENEAGWASLSAWTRNTYAGGPPGDPLDDEGPPAASRTVADTTTGRTRFGVIQIRATSLDWVLLARGNNRRAVFDYAGDGSIAAGAWIAP